jgi:hypothetical protein
MKSDAKPDRHDDEGREPLRELLRGWSVPPVPAEIEDALRQEFRRRRPRRPRVVWLSLAAAALLAAWPLASSIGGKGAVAPAPPANPAVAPSRPQPLAATSAHGAVAPVAGVRSPVGRTPTRNVLQARPEEPAVVVEPAQAELLAELGRAVWARTESAPGGSLQGMPAEETPAYGAEWEELAGEWPAVQVVVPRSGR